MILIAGVLLCLGAPAMAQSSGGGNGGSRDAASVSASGGNRGALHHKQVRKVKKTKSGKKKVAVQKVPLEEDKMYPWKNGQRATPTGNEATGTNGQGFSAPRKDSVLHPRRERR
ncbi:hypothetical protein GCM10023184_08980 [Flaviaesturariibacter amylovorans]|uniref:Uncharacterized protein n=2 Tax=Flaviaesturariibacter amylovorans TaxID=1084520 RepID=A0ABP8GEN7_9BACT